MRTRTIYGMSILVGGILLAAPQQLFAQGALQRLGGILDQIQNGQPAQPSTGTPTPAVPPPAPGTVSDRPYLGAKLGVLEEASDPILNPGNQGQSGGIVVTEVNPGGPAEKAGLEVGDEIVSFNKMSYSTLDQVGAMMSGKQPGDRLALKIERDGQYKDVEVVLGNQPSELPAPQTTGGAYDPLNVEGAMPQAEQLPAAAPGRPVLGVRVLPLDDQLRAQTGISVRRGAFVDSVVRGGVADQAGIPTGAVIVAYDGRRVDDAKELIQMVRTSPDNRPIPVNYYVGNRLESTNLFYGDPRDMPVQPGGASVGEDRPILRMLQNGLQQMDGGAGGGQMVSPEQVESLSRRVRELEQEVRQLREELTKMKEANGEDL